MLELAPRPILMTDSEFDRFLERGAAESLGRIELRRGRLVQMSPQNLPHGRFKTWIYKRLEAAIAAGPPLVLDMEVTVRFGAGFRPMPDLTLWTGGPLVGTIPGDKVKLCVEVADESLADDLGPKREDYAKAGLPEYWVLDVNARALHRFYDLAEGDYRKRDIVRDGETLASATLADVSFLFVPPQFG